MREREFSLWINIESLFIDILNNNSFIGKEISWLMNENLRLLVGFNTCVFIHPCTRIVTNYYLSKKKNYIMLINDIMIFLEKGCTSLNLHNKMGLFINHMTKIQYVVLLF